MQSRLSPYFAALILVASSTFAQEFRASITSQITDSSGAPIANAKVKVTNLERNTVSDVVWNSRGIYLVQFLLPGQYTLAIESPGFKPYLQRGISLEASDHASVDVRLEIGSHADQITVEGQTPLLETESTTRATTVENRVLENIPTNGRNLFALQYNLSGVVKSGS